jgi:hypothetical protein
LEKQKLKEHVTPWPELLLVPSLVVLCNLSGLLDKDGLVLDQVDRIMMCAEAVWTTAYVTWDCSLYIHDTAVWLCCSHLGYSHTFYFVMSLVDKQKSIFCGVWLIYLKNIRVL